MMIFIIALLLVIILCFLVKNDIKTIPILDVDNNQLLPGKKYKLDFSHLVFPDGEIGSLCGNVLYIIKGNRYRTFALSDGRELHLENGDCIVVDIKITVPDINKYRAFIVSENGNKILKTSDEVTAEDLILGAVCSKIPGSVMDNQLWEK